MRLSGLLMKKKHDNYGTDRSR